MKRAIITWIAALSLILTIGAHQGPGSSVAKAAETVTIWNTVGAGYLEMLQYALEPFLEENPDITVEWQSQGLYDPLIVAIAGGVGPDIFLGASLTDTEYGVQGLQVDLTPLLARDGLLEEIYQDVFPGVLQGSVFKDAIYGIPFSTQIVLPYYNANNFHEMGVAEPRAGWTWDDMHAMLPRLRRANPDGEIEVDAMLSRLSGHTAKFFMRMIGGNIWDPETYEFQGRTEPFRQSLETAKDLSNRGLLRTFQIEVNEHVDRFIRSQASFYLDINIRINTIEQDPVAADFVRVAPAIRWADGYEPRYDSSHRSIALATPADGHVSEPVWRVFKYLISTEGMARMTAYMDLLPPRYSVINHPHFQDYLSTTSDAFIRIATEIAPHSYAPGATGMPEGRAVYDQFNALVTRFLKGEISFSALVDEHETISRERLDKVRALLEQ